ncbi:MAG: hypothetical protein A2Y92_01345 [Chloroflexi bacterium RBG_13_57_8]|nr:MAG: hypothetical protein A2Y92_01345 [Chloroflexi bacterium RBG_13_57_8]
MKNNAARPRYIKGQQVIIQPVKESGLSQRESDINKYAGQVGTISKFYWISPRTEQIFYIYNVRVGMGKKEIVVYEDELEPKLS